MISPINLSQSMGYNTLNCKKSKMAFKGMEKVPNEYPYVPRVLAHRREINYSHKTGALLNMNDYDLKTGKQLRTIWLRNDPGETVWRVDNFNLEGKHYKTTCYYDDEQTVSRIMEYDPDTQKCLNVTYYNELGDVTEHLDLQG